MSCKPRTAPHLIIRNCRFIPSPPGDWWVQHQRERAKEVGVQQVARNLRKQGCPLWVALEVLAVLD